MSRAPSDKDHFKNTGERKDVTVNKEINWILIL
jgi:hypothetical protein